jgi:hypothetical protein
MSNVFSGGCYKFLNFFPQRRRRLMFASPYVTVAAELKIH